MGWFTSCPNLLQIHAELVSLFGLMYVFTSLFHKFLACGHTTGRESSQKLLHGKCTMLLVTSPQKAIRVSSPLLRQGDQGSFWVPHCILQAATCTSEKRRRTYSPKAYSSLDFMISRTIPEPYTLNQVFNLCCPSFLANNQTLNPSPKRPATKESCARAWVGVSAPASDSCLRCWQSENLMLKSNWLEYTIRQWGRLVLLPYTGNSGIAYSSMWLVLATRTEILHVV